MATVNFSVPDDVKTEFGVVFAHENKSAVITRLMRQAIDEARLAQRRKSIIASMTRARAKRPSFTHDEIMTARHADRP